MLRPTDTIQRTFSIASGLALRSAARIFITMPLYTASLNSRRLIWFSLVCTVPLNADTGIGGRYWIAPSILP